MTEIGDLDIGQIFTVFGNALPKQDVWKTLFIPLYLYCQEM